MVITLTGENAHGVQEMLHVLMRAFVAEHGDMALERLDGETAGFGRLQEALQSVPFLAGRKLVVLRTPGANKQFSEEAGRLLAGIPEATDVIIVEPKLDKRGSYYKLLRNITDYREFGAMDEQALARWLVTAAKEQGGSLSPADARLLVERIGANQQLVAAELAKLLIYDATVTRATIELLTDASPQSTIFELLEAAFAGNGRRVLAIYRDQREQKVDTAQIIAMLTWQLRVLALLKAAAGRTAQDIAAAARLSPFVVRKSQPIAARLSRPRLKQLVGDLLEIDVRSKREGVDADEALQNYLLALGAH